MSSVYLHTGDLHSFVCSSLVNRYRGCNQTICCSLVNKQTNITCLEMFWIGRRFLAAYMGKFYVNLDVEWILVSVGLRWACYTDTVRYTNTHIDTQRHTRGLRCPFCTNKHQHRGPIDRQRGKKT